MTLDTKHGSEKYGMRRRDTPVNALREVRGRPAVMLATPLVLEPMADGEPGPLLPLIDWQAV
jgi:hypothetical protein